MHSRVARSLRLRRPLRWLDRFALTAHFSGVAPLPHAEVHFFPGGYFAATTVDGGMFGVNCVVARSALRARGARSWDGFVAARAQMAPFFVERIARAHRLAPWRGIGPLAFRTTRQHLPGAALVGDACGYVDPMTGEGIYFALFGARRLAVALTEALHDRAVAARALAAYAADRRREVAPRLFLARLLQRGLPHAFVVRTLLGALSRHPWLADLLVTLTGDGAHPRDLLRPSFWRQFARGGAPSGSPASPRSRC